jgi:hypothetical protein
MRTKQLVAVVTVVGSIVAGAGAAVACPQDGLDRARAGTARYHDVDLAAARGFSQLNDAAGIACIDNPGVGGMGIHYVKGSRVEDPAVRAGAPEVLVYEPRASGRLRLVAVEYVVLKSAWEAAGHARPPRLFGKRFTLTPAGNRYGLPAFYELHAWIWKHNPRGMFDDWNPRVSCPQA